MFSVRRNFDFYFLKSPKMKSFQMTTWLVICHRMTPVISWQGPCHKSDPPCHKLWQVRTRPKLVEPGGTRTGHFRNRKKKSWFMGSFALHSCVTYKLLFAGFDAIVWHSARVTLSFNPKNLAAWEALILPTVCWLPMMTTKPDSWSGSATTASGSNNFGLPGWFNIPTTVNLVVGMFWAQEAS